jgi:hypothetical protein
MTKGFALAPVGAQRRRAVADGVLAPLAGLIAGHEFGSHVRLGLSKPAPVRSARMCQPVFSS